MKPDQIAELLARVTAGWRTAPGAKAESLTAARKALAASVALGKTAADVHPAGAPLASAMPDANLTAEIGQVLAGTPELSNPSELAFVRTATAADVRNPAGIPAWARGMQVQQTHGPFLDAQGQIHWVDVIRVTTEGKFAFGSAASVFAVFPVRRSIIHPPGQLALGEGSVWFAAKLLVNSIPANNYTGFRIKSGSLKASVPFAIDNGVYVLPATEALTLTATLEPPAAAASAGPIGADQSSSAVQLPATVTLVFKQNSAAVTALDNSGVQIYGSTVSLPWNHQPPTSLLGNAQILISCTPAPSTFTFSSVQSTLFRPSGSAPITRAGWALPVAATTITALGQASGAGSVYFELGPGATAAWEAHQVAVAVSDWQIQIDPAKLLVIITGTAPPVTTTFQLWPERAPSTRRSSVAFLSLKGVLASFMASAGSEQLSEAGQATAHLDRPLAADGTRFPLQGSGALVIVVNSAGTRVAIIATVIPAGTDTIPIALENALIGVHPPSVFLVSGMMQATTFVSAQVAIAFGVSWILPMLPDPYAASFGLDFIANQTGGTSGPLIALMTWPGQEVVNLSLVLGLQSAQTPSGTASGGSNLLGLATGGRAALANVQRLALLDVSTNIDQFGVAIAPSFRGEGGVARTPGAAAPSLGFAGLDLALNGALVATFALPQVSWEPMESTAFPSGAIFSDPASDGVALVLQAPDEQQLVPFAPGPVLRSNIANVVAGKSFQAEFSLPFGLIARIQQPNRPPNPNGPKGAQSLFLSEGGEFQLTRPTFPSSLLGALQLTLKPPFPDDPRAQFGGSTSIDTHGAAPGYGVTVIGDGNVLSVANIFKQEFDVGGTNPGVPVRRIDLAGYGASIFSEWADLVSEPPDITKVQFETVVGRTAYEVVQAATILYPYGPKLVRTVTMQRQNAGWVKRTDSGWQPTSPGIFVYPNAAAFAGRIHRGAVAGVFNIRNIRVQAPVFTVPRTPPADPPFTFQEVLFDADIGIDSRVQVLAGGKASTLVDANNQPVTLVPARDLVGYVQAAPDKLSPGPNELAALFAQTGPVTVPFSCIAEIGGFLGKPGTVLRCAAIEVDMPITTDGPNPAPAVAAALRAAPKLPRDGAWGVGQRKRTDPAPSPLPKDFPLPLVQPASDHNNWHFADIADVLQLDNPANLYGILQDTGTQKVLFERPTVPQFSLFSPPGSIPGIKLPNPPNFADVASLLNATGLFPDISSTISLFVSGAVEQLDTQADGLKYSKTYKFDPNRQPLSLLDLGVIKVALSYADESQGRSGGAANAPTVLTYNVDPAAARRWSFSVTPLTFLVTVPEFSSNPLLMIVGGFVADDQTKPTLAGLHIVYGDALASLTSVLDRLQSLASFLPGGKGAGLQVSLSDGKLTVRDVFAIPSLPLGLGEITDVSLDLGLTLQLSPLSADFSVGIGGPDNPFNWIVSPLAGNGLVVVGVKGGQPELMVQGGIGLGLAIDVGIAEGSASITIAAKLDVTGNTITLMAILTGHASVDVLGGLASASLTLTAAVGFSLHPFPPQILLTGGFPPTGVDFKPEDITLLASVSVGIHISICWVVSVDWDGSWQFSQTVHTPELQASL